MLLDLAALAVVASLAVLMAMVVWNHAAKRPEASSRNYALALQAARLLDSILQSDDQVPILTEAQRDAATKYLERFYNN